MCHLIGKLVSHDNEVSPALEESFGRERESDLKEERTE